MRMTMVGGTVGSRGFDMANLQTLIDAARSRAISPSEMQAQRRSFAYGNTKIENDRITREMVDQQDELLQMEVSTR